MPFSRRPDRVAPSQTSLAGVVAACAFAVASTGHAQTETNLSATNTLFAEARTDNANGTLGDDHYAIVVNRLNLNGNAGDVSSQLRVDAFYLANFCNADRWDYAPADRNGDGFADAFDYGTTEGGVIRSERDDGIRDGIDLTGDGIPDVSDIDGDGIADPFPSRCVPIPRRVTGAPRHAYPDSYDWAYRNDIVLERLNVSYRRGDWTLTAGDTFRQLGRGIVLAVRKVDEAGLDIALRGGSVEYRGDDHRLAVFAGRANPANLDAINQQYVEPVDDVIAGYDYQLRAVDGLRLNFFAAYLEQGEPLFPDRGGRDFNFSQGVGVTLPSLTDWLSIYAEGDVQTRRVGDTSTMGLAAYLTADFVHRDFSVLAESIALDDFEQAGSGNTALSGARFAYNQAPTLERIDQETLNASSVLGARLRVEQYIFAADTTLYASGNVLVNHRGQPDELRQMHGYAGVKTYYANGSSRIEVSGGYRDETQTNLPAIETAFATLTPGHNQLKSMRHGELDWVHAFGAGNAFHLTSRNEFRELENEPRQRGSLLVGLERSGLGAATFEFGYNNEVTGPGIRTFFFAGILKWEATDWLTCTATGGTQRGGIKCINGVCREYPAFSGARLELVGRF